MKAAPVESVEKHKAQMELECAVVDFSNILYVLEMVDRGYDLQLAMQYIREAARDGLIHALELLYPIEGMAVQR